MTDQDRRIKSGVDDRDETDPDQTIDSGVSPVPLDETRYQAYASDSQQGSTVRRSVDAVPKAGRRPAPGVAPEQFGRYQIKRKLGEGAMGVVYLALDQQLDRQVALKVPFFTETDGPNVIHRFYREARAMATLRHTNLCSVFDVGEIDGVHFLAMEFIDGRPLAEYLQKGQPLPGRQVATVIHKLALALDEAHRADIIHRDLKPANIMINQRKEPIVMDFGLARRDIEGEAALTHTGTIMGTPAYMAPEQILGIPDKIGPHTDVFALGVMLYQMICGQRPFTGALAAMLPKILKDEPPAPSEVHAKVDPELARISLKALSKQVEDRYHSAGDMAAELGRFLKGDQRQRPARSPAAVKPSRSVTPQSPARSPAHVQPVVVSQSWESDFNIQLAPESAMTASGHRRLASNRGKGTAPGVLTPVRIALTAGGLIALVLVAVFLFWNRDAGEPEEPDLLATVDLQGGPVELPDGDPQRQIPTASSAASDSQDAVQPQDDRPTGSATETSTDRDEIETGTAGAENSAPRAVAKTYTALPGVDVNNLSDAVFQELLKWCHNNFCPCGCKLSFAGCRNDDRTCERSVQLIGDVVMELEAQRVRTAEEAIGFFKQRDEEPKNATNTSPTEGSP